MSTVTVKIPTPLRPITGGQPEVRIDGATVGEILRNMDAQFKGFGDRVLDDGRSVKRFINVFVNEDNIRDRKELDTEVRNGDTISILPSIAGGNGASVISPRQYAVGNILLH
jgi:molybdopterin converting factor small subunit